MVSNKLAQDVLSGFAAGATGTAMNCWTDVPRRHAKRWPHRSDSRQRPPRTCDMPIHIHLFST